MSDAIRPFTIAIPQATLDDLAARIDLTRWPERETVDDWSQGVPLAELRALVDYWRNGYDWRACEARLNALPQFITTIDGLDIHFIHVRSAHENATPLILTHGWPGSVLEFLDAIPRLVDPEAHGGTAADAFHVVVPALPGYGFSGKPEATGWGLDRIAQAWSVLMGRLGYDRWFAQGGDWGSVVTVSMAVQEVPGCAGIHLNLVSGQPTEAATSNPTPEDRKAFEKIAHYMNWDGAYAQQQRTRPQTLGYGLTDSPVGQAAWIFEKMWAWTDNNGSPYDALSRDQILDNITLYWVTASAASSARLYWEVGNVMRDGEINLPTAYTQFPHDLFTTPRAWLENRFRNIVYAAEAECGGHFAAWEQPDIFVREVRAAFAAMR